MREVTLIRQALVRVYIKQPVVTRIVRDERLPVIWFVANCGGILGLCMGFSIVTVFEVLHYLGRTVLHLCKKRRRKGEGEAASVSPPGGNAARDEAEGEMEIRQGRPLHTILVVEITINVSHFRSFEGDSKESSGGGCCRGCCPAPSWCCSVFGWRRGRRRRRQQQQQWTNGEGKGEGEGEAEAMVAGKQRSEEEEENTTVEAVEGEEGQQPLSPPPPTAQVANGSAKKPEASRTGMAFNNSTLKYEINMISVQLFRAPSKCRRPPRCGRGSISSRGTLPRCCPPAAPPASPFPPPRATRRRGAAGRSGIWTAGWR